MRKSLFIISLLSGLIFYGCSSTSTDPDDSTTQFQVALSSSPADAGDATPEAGQYDEGTTLEISATANEGWRFVEWTGDHTGTNSTTTITVDADKNISAIYDKKSYALTTNTSGEGTVDGKIVAAKATDYDHGTVVELTANPATGWIFVEWQGDVTGSQNPHELTVDNPKDVTAVFQKKTFSLTLSTTGQGSIAKNPDQQEYEYDTVVELTANAENGWQFSEWQGGITGTNNPVQLTVDEGKNVTAVFMENSQSLFYLAQNGVTIKCEDATIGDTGTVNGITYTKRSAGQITPSNAETTCTSGIRNMSNMFSGEDNFNGDISSWDVSAVTDMENMFHNVDVFNQDLSKWDVASVTDMNHMFSGAYSSSFNADIGGWNVSSVTDMSSMFAYTGSFDQDLNNWNVSNVTDMSYMFYKATVFKGDISSWDVASVTDMSNMFATADSFNGDLNSWDVSNVRDMGGMFNNADSFNGDIGDWNVANVTKMRYTFGGADSFNQDLDLWNVRNVEDMEGMFASAYAFDGKISSWDVGSVTDMSRMFIRAGLFNKDLSSWIVSNVRDMNHMFNDASSFNQDLSGWCVANVNDNFYFSNGSSMSSSDLPVWGTCPGGS
jgi:surface protein